MLEGRLVLQHNKKAYDLWNQDLAGNLVKADRNWPGLVEKNGVSGKMLLNLDGKGVALGGNDPLSYFAGAKPVKGDPSHMATYNGAIYHFATEENRATFEQEPARYAPAFGGYCGYGASLNKVVDVQLDVYGIVDGRLVLQHSRKTLELFDKDQKASLAKADANWPGLVEKNGK
ncbi:MAG: hypothetical protein HC813_03915 [Planctomycetes bacterium]|nr:hypothetical protein [Planctomycetota bacterium]